MGSGTQPFVAGGTSWSIILKVNVPEQSSQSMSIWCLVHRYLVLVTT